jgi:uncharacterized protein with HEPN domain
MLDSAQKIEYLTRLLYTQDSFEERWVEQDAIIRNLEIIGEASASITDELKQKYPDVAWREMKGMRNFVTHQYFGVELSDIWSTAVNDIPLLKKQLQKMLEDME